MTAPAEAPGPGTVKGGPTTPADIPYAEAPRGTLGEAMGTPLAWVIFWLATLGFTYAFWHRVAPSVMVDGLMAEFNVGGGVLGNLSAMYLYIYVALQLPVGILVERFGPRILFAVSITSCAAGTVLFGYADNVLEAYIGRFIVGAGSAFAFVSTLSLAADWFPSRRQAMLGGCLMMMGMGGGIAGQWILPHMVESVGWRESMFWTAGAGFVLAGLMWLVIRKRRAARQTSGKLDEPATMREVFAGLGKVMRKAQSWYAGIYACTMSGGLLGFGALWGIPFLMQTRDYTRVDAGATVSFLLFGWALGAPLWGWVSDHVGRRRLPMMIAPVFALASFMAVILVEGLGDWSMRALLFVNGASGGAMVIAFATSREHNAGLATGTVYGLVNMLGVGGGAVLQPVMGLLLDLRWTGTLVDGARVYGVDAYLTAFAIVPAFYVLGFILAVATRETYCRPVEG